MHEPKSTAGTGRLFWSEIRFIRKKAFTNKHGINAVIGLWLRKQIAANRPLFIAPFLFFMVVFSSVIELNDSAGKVLLYKLEV